jgi:hypothetical protein
MKLIILWTGGVFGLAMLALIALSLYSHQQEAQWGAAMAEADRAGRQAGKGSDVAQCWKRSVGRRESCWNPLAKNCRDAARGFLLSCSQVVRPGAELCALLAKEPAWRCGGSASQSCPALRAEAQALCDSERALEGALE